MSRYVAHVPSRVYEEIVYWYTVKYNISQSAYMRSLGDANQNSIIP